MSLQIIYYINILTLPLFNGIFTWFSGLWTKEIVLHISWILMYCLYWTNNFFFGGGDLYFSSMPLTVLHVNENHKYLFMQFYLVSNVLLTQRRMTWWEQRIVKALLSTGCSATSPLAILHRSRQQLQKWWWCVHVCCFQKRPHRSWLFWG